MFNALRVTEHRGNDDLLTAGLGRDGLRALAAPAFADAEHPTAAELRRRALWSNWRGIADLAPGGGYGDVYGSTASVPGREFSALATVPGASQPHRVLVQVPDAFDVGKRCVVVTASSGSRGIYGAIAVAGAWGLPKGCAVAYTDKGAGTDYFDLDAGQGARADGTPGARGGRPRVRAGHGRDVRRRVQARALARQPRGRLGPPRQAGGAVRAAVAGQRISAGGAFHVRQHPRDRGRHLQRRRRGAARGGTGHERRDRAGSTRSSPASPTSPSKARVRSYDYTTEAALLMPCALLDPALAPLPQPPLTAQAAPLWTQRCAALKAAGLIEGADAAAQARSAHAQLRATGWSDEALRAGALSVGFDLWRAVAVTYASTYGRYGAGEHPCGYAFAASNPDFSPRAATAAERAAWWADASGIPPGAGVGIVDATPAWLARCRLRCAAMPARAVDAATAPTPARARGHRRDPRRPAARGPAGGGDPRPRRRPDPAGLQQRAVRGPGEGRRPRRALLAGAQRAAFRRASSACRTTARATCRCCRTSTKRSTAWSRTSTARRRCRPMR